MKETKIYVGLNDSGIQSQKYDDSVYVSVLKKVCSSYKVPFSFNMSESSNGEWVAINI